MPLARLRVEALTRVRGVMPVIRLPRHFAVFDVDEFVTPRMAVDGKRRRFLEPVEADHIEFGQVVGEGEVCSVALADPADGIVARARHGWFHSSRR